MKSLSRREFLRGAAVAGAGLAALVAGCAPQVSAPASGVDVEAPPAVAAPTGKTKIVYYDRTTQAPAWAEAFNKVQDEIEVDVEIQPPGTRYEQLIAAISAGNAPDVIGVDCVQVGRFGRMKALRPLQDLIPEESKFRYFQNLISEPGHFGFHDGDILGVPFWLDMSVMYYDKSELEAAGGDPEKGFLSWHDIMDYGKAATREGFFGLSFGRVNEFIWGPYVWAQGGNYINEEWTESWIDQPAYTNMLQFFYDIVHVHQITNDAAGTAWGEMNDLFTGKRAMAVHGGGGMVGLVRREFPELWDNLRVCLIPGPEEGQNSSFIGGNVASISMQSKEVAASRDFVVWMTDTDEGQTVTGEVGYLCGTPEGLNLPVYKTDWHLYSVFLKGLETGFASWNDPRFDEAGQIARIPFEQVLIGDRPIPEMVAAAHDELDRLLKR